eukprot:3648766-Heterocapsa_arctica.AAC.1
MASASSRSSRRFFAANLEFAWSEDRRRRRWSPRSCKRRFAFASSTSSLFLVAANSPVAKMS